MTAQKLQFHELQCKTASFFPEIPIDNRSVMSDFSYFGSGLYHVPADFTDFITLYCNKVKNAQTHFQDQDLKHYQDFYPDVSSVNIIRGPLLAIEMFLFSVNKVSSLYVH